MSPSPAIRWRALRFEFLFAIAVAATIPSASAQYVTNFEALNASASGTVLTGQDNYTLPAGSIDYLAYTYAGNTLSIPPNPFGNAQFVAGTPMSTSVFARGERTVPFGCNRGKWTIGADVLGKFTGAGAAAQNLGSLSLQPSTTARSLIMLATWVATATPTAWNANIQWYNATGGAGTPTLIPDTNFQNLPVDKWYRWATDFDFTTNQILEIRLTDLATNTTVTYVPTGWYLQGGMGGGTFPFPTAIRMFTGGLPGNVMAWDNIRVLPEAASTTVFGCTNPAASLTVLSGTPRIGSTVTLGVHNPAGTQTNGSVPIMLISLTRDPGMCGTPIPGLGMAGGPGELLIGSILPVVLIGGAWIGAPVPFAIPIPADCNLVGASAFVQGVMIGAPGSMVMIGLARAAELKLREV